MIFPYVIIIIVALHHVPCISQVNLRLYNSLESIIMVVLSDTDVTHNVSKAIPVKI